MTRDGQNARFTGHHRFVTVDGEILRHPGDCPGNPRERSNKKPRPDVPTSEAERLRLLEQSREMRRQVAAYKRAKSSGGEP